MSWLQLQLCLSPERLETVEAALIELGALSTTYDDASDTPIFEPLPGQTPLWSRLRLTALFQDDVDLDTLLAAYQSELSPEEAKSARWSRLEDEQWERAWMDHYKPMQFGPNFWVVPHHLEAPDPQAINLRLDPGLAFGTGTHQTTAMCIRWLAAQTWPKAKLLDFGCGSGILGVAAALLGAQQVHCVDIDPQAVTATRSNSESNATQDRLQASLSEDYRIETHDCVVANILLAPLIELRDVLLDSLVLGGPIAMTGLIERDAQRLIDAYAERCELSIVDELEGWVLVAGQRKV